MSADRFDTTCPRCGFAPHWGVVIPDGETADNAIPGHVADHALEDGDVAICGRCFAVNSAEGNRLRPMTETEWWQRSPDLRNELTRMTTAGIRAARRDRPREEWAETVTLYQTLILRALKASEPDPLNATDLLADWLCVANEHPVYSALKALEEDQVIGTYENNASAILAGGEVTMMIYLRRPA